MAQAKTNAIRLLERENIPYIMHEYTAEEGAIDGVSVAHKTGQEPARVFKTLVAQGATGQIFVFCIPVEAHLNLKAAARAAGEKNIAMIAVKEINKFTGYVRGGCSPLGMKKAYPTFIDESAHSFSTILVSGGRIGTQVELNPAQLANAAGASFANIAHYDLPD